MSNPELYKKNGPALTHADIMIEMRHIVEDFLVRCGARYGGAVTCVLDNSVVRHRLDRSIEITNKAINNRMRRDFI